LDIHYPKARVLSITQAKEAGTLYALDELRVLTETARKFGMKVHMDGARFANAIAATGVKPREMTWELGVDVLCFGGTKNGMAIGEAVVFFNLELAKEFDYRCKQAGQLASKMRFVSSSWVGMLQDGAWLKRAGHGNKMAKRLEAALRGVPQIQLAFPVETNGVFIFMPPQVIQQLKERWKFTPHVRADNCRLMCSWDTTEEDVDAFAADVKKLVS
jgi:threonine aldolase